jgi:hypothetical protein
MPGRPQLASRGHRRATDDTLLYTSLPVATSASSWGSNASMVETIGAVRAMCRPARSTALLRRSVAAARFSARSGN